MREAISWRVLMWFGLLALFLSLETWIFGPYSYVPLHDTGNGQVPAFHMLVRSVREYGLSYWYPFHLAGNDESATYSLFQLVTPFFMFLPIWLAFSAVLIIQHFLGGLSMYVFCRARLDMNKVASAIAGIAYTSPIIIMFGAQSHQEWWMNNYLEYRLAYAFAVPALPLFCLAIDYASERARILQSGLIGLGIGAALVLSMFFIAFWPYTLAVLGIYSITMGRGRYRARLVVLLAVTAASGLLQIDHLIAASNLYPQSHRALMDLVHMSFGPVGAAGKVDQSWFDLVMLFVRAATDVPDILDQMWRLFFIEFPIQITVIVVVFLAALVVTRQRERYADGLLPIIFTCLVFVALIILAGPIHAIMSQKLGKLFARLHFGYYTWGIGAKFLLVMAFGYALHIISEWRGSRWLTAWRIPVIAVVGIIPIIYATSSYKITSILHWAQNGSSFANYESPQMQELKQLAAGSGPYRVASITGHSPPMSLHPNFVNPLGFESVDGYENLYALRYGRFFLAVINPQKENYLDQFVRGHIGRSLDDRPAVSNMLYIVNTSNELRRMVDLDLLALANVRYILSPVALDDPRLKLVLKPGAAEMSGLPPVARWLHDAMLPALRKFFSFNISATYQINLIDQTLPINFGGRQIFVYENTLALPRAFVAPEMEVHSPENVWRALPGRSTNELMLKAIVEAPVALPPPQGTTIEASAPRFVHYQPGSYAIEGVAAMPALLVITNSYSEYWMPEVNGKAAKAMPAYGAFTAVPVPAGRFTVTMRYEPPTALSRLGFGAQR